MTGTPVGKSVIPIPMPHARWFSGARLNWAQHALRHGADDATAARDFDGWLASGYRSTPDQIMAAHERYRAAGGQRAIVCAIPLDSRDDLGPTGEVLRRYARASASMTPSYSSDPVGQIRRRSGPCSRGNRRRPESGMCRNGRCRVAEGQRALPCPLEDHRWLHQVRRLRSLHRSNRYGRSLQGRSRSHRDGGEAHPG